MKDDGSEIIELRVGEDGIRIDSYISRHLPQFSRSRAKKLIEEDQVVVNGREVRPSFKPRTGDVIVIRLLPPVSPYLQPLPVKLDIVYEDDDLLVINKPAGMPVHPGPGHTGDTLVNAVLAHCPKIAGIKGTMRPGVVHRLDKETSGLIIFAKNDQAMVNLQQQFKTREVRKGYIALVRGNLVPPSGVIEGPIGRDPTHRQRMAIVAGGREARTSYRVIKYFSGYTLIEVHPETGRTHQIRVHLAAAGHPVAGDAVYGVSKSTFSRQFLHANVLGFRIPSTGKFSEFEVGLPEDLKEALRHVQAMPEKRKE